MLTLHKDWHFLMLPSKVSDISFPARYMHRGILFFCIFCWGGGASAWNIIIDGSCTLPKTNSTFLSASSHKNLIGQNNNKNSAASFHLILSHDRVTVDGFWIDNWIYWILAWLYNSQLQLITVLSLIHTLTVQSAYTKLS
jgi:hypothetical protein